MNACNPNANYVGMDYAQPSTVGTYPNTDSCGSRLPCGLCLLTNQPCPMRSIRAILDHVLTAEDRALLKEFHPQR